MSIIFITVNALNGGIRRLQRHGLKADGNYGKIDNLHISYNGNRITTVLEDADPVTQSGSMDYPGANREMRFGYNDWGALVSDESRGIESIEYDNFGNQVHIKFSGRDYTKNVYSATGVKLKTEHFTDPLVVGPPAVGEIHQSDPVPADMQTSTGNFGPGTLEPGAALLAGQEKIEYHGPVIYRNFKIDMVLFPGGYATIGNDNAVTFHYYTQDYLGNNRAIVNGSTGAIEQMTAYYPYGAVIPDLGTGNSGQPFKFGGKELVSANGLNAFDFGARLHYPAIPQFDRIDSMCEKFAWLSPYLYCANNPVNFTDPTGMELVFSNGNNTDYSYICKLLANITSNQYVFNYEISNETNEATISYSPNEEFTSELSENQQKTNNRVTEIIDHPKKTAISIKNNSEVIVGDIEKGIIDLADIKNIGRREAVTSESAFLHETYEQFWLQSRGRDSKGHNSWHAHSAASTVDSEYLNMSVSPHRNFIFGNGYEIIGLQFQYNTKSGVGYYPNSMIVRINNYSILPNKKDEKSH